MTSACSSSSSAFSKRKIRGVTASNQKFWIQVDALSVTLTAAAETSTETTESNLAHWIQRESGMPSALAFALRVLLSSFILNAASRNAATASEIGTSGPCDTSLSSTLSLEITSLSSSLVLFWGGSQAGKICAAELHAGSWLLQVFVPFCMALSFSVVNSSCMDLTLVDSICKASVTLRYSPSIWRNNYCHSQIKSQWKETTCSFCRHYAFLRNLVSWLFKMTSYPCNYANYMLIWNWAF